MQLHHVSIRTADIFRAIEFYQHLGLTVETRFTTGITLACWMTGSLGRLELIQVPEPAPAPDAFGDPHFVGYYHLSLQVENLAELLAELIQVGGRVLLDPVRQEIGDQVFEVAFLADPDGVVIELLQAVM